MFVHFGEGAEHEGVGVLRDRDSLERFDPLFDGECRFRPAEQLDDTFLTVESACGGMNDLPIPEIETAVLVAVAKSERRCAPGHA